MTGAVYFMVFVLPFSKAAVSICMAVSFLMWVLKRAAGFRSDGWRGLLPVTPLNKALLVFIFFNVLSVVFSTNVGQSLEALFTKTLKYIFVFFIAVEALGSARRIRGFLSVVALSGGLMIADAAVQFFHGTDVLKGYAFGARLSASFMTPTGFAGWLVIVLMVFWGWLCEAGSRLQWQMRATLLGLIAGLMLCLLMTYSRGGWLGFVVAALIFVMYFMAHVSWRVRVACFFLVLVGIIGLSMLPRVISRIGQNRPVYHETVMGRVLSAVELKKGSTPIRFGLWREAGEIMRDYPVTGCGLNTYSDVARAYKQFEGGGIYPHNSYLQMAAEIGVPGLLAFLAVVGIFFQMTYRYCHRHRDFLAAGMAAGVLGFLIHAFFDTHLYSLQMVTLFWVGLGVTTACVRVRGIGPRTDAEQTEGGACE